MSYTSVTGHRSMALDRVRNAAYANALKRVVTPDTVVLDLGAGLGIHGLMAARMGAKRVYLVEPEDVIAVAEENVRANGLADVVECVHGRIEDVTLPEPVDVIVSALTGNMLVTEDLLPHLFHARDTYLRPSGTMIPDRAAIDIAAVSAPKFHAREVADWSTSQSDVSLAPVRQCAANDVYFRWDRTEATYLSAPASVHRLDLLSDGYTAVHAQVDLPIHTDGVCHGLAGWFTIQLGEQRLSTAPDAEATHWSPAMLPLDPPLPCSSGDVLTVRLDRPPHGDWSWRVRSGKTEQRHSTLLAAAIKTTTLRKAAADYLPSLNQEGEIVAHVLQRCDGHTPVRDIAAAVQQRWPQRYRTEDDALRFVQSLMKRLT